MSVSSNNILYDQMFGLTTLPPGSGISIANVKYAWFMSYGATAVIYIDGSYVFGSSTPYTTSTVFSVIYDGTEGVKFYQDNVLIYTYTGYAGGSLLYLGSTIIAYAGLTPMVKNLVFGPLGPSISTGITGPTGYASANVLNINSSGLVTYNNYIRGTVTADGTTPVSVSNSLVQENSIIVLNRNSSTAVNTLPAFVSSLTVGTGFTIVNTVADSSNYNYLIQ
jgi:hypothetical protein